MQNTVQDTYFSDQVLTAPPQKLQLMLIEGAIRFSLLAKRHWSENRAEEASDALIRSQEIVTELMCAARNDSSELARQVVAVYFFIFRRLVEAHLRQDAGLLDDALRVLEEERMTWRQVCERLAGEAPVGSSDTISVTAVDQPASVVPPPAGSIWSPISSPASELVPEGGFSFEA